ncbi:hypothetical protein KZX37_03505 [Microbacterium sp. EYE_5]|uniref:hypothetical protein n=1 Tax=unclassified Microbacterium TaxID=2609290 RepID=UPI0020052E63|nr:MULTISPECIES: hypothetical protein [unclassified Microbacterium]MCK6079686.1 hypothetical protein [Microbacterium sp. EYE_382]MCK6084957.1 hypothetical protein [Microbacterium sp. EYE_384]MCK6122817.1 hypothetical protein [Microbacterium sp. EYE_80]MCK6125720.1 hypothetical protein [Microbacterium sp. EYE_79]MCK6140641.1 hypothetical protein [Microbacterium sp. EYE_39]
MSRSTRGCRRAASVSSAALAILLTGCVSTVGVDEAAPSRSTSPSAPPSVSPTPTPTASSAVPLPEYRVPRPDPEEISRLEHESDGPDGPVTRMQVTAPVEPDVEYQVEYDCRAEDPTATFTLEWSDASADVLEPGDGGRVLATCDGPAAVAGIVFASASPLQLTLRDAESIDEVWARMRPAR